MLISSMLPWSQFGVGLAPYERIRARGTRTAPEPTRTRRLVPTPALVHELGAAMQTAPLLFQTALCREVLRFTSDGAALLKGQASNSVPSRKPTQALN
jgi:hypothetical protein